MTKTSTKDSVVRYCNHKRATFLGVSFNRNFFIVQAQLRDFGCWKACNEKISYLLIFLFFSIYSCKEKTHPQTAIFIALNETETGLNFVNKLTPTGEMNVFKYMYYYNGGGIGAGDFNKDGLIDLFFTANQSPNKLFINKGGLKFSDATVAAGIPQDGGWATGVSVVDVNNDGLLDIYVCKVSQFENLKGRNQLLVCVGVDKNGIPAYSDKAKEYGLDFSGFSTQSAFLDYDLDGDLDMYLLNHSVHHKGNYNKRSMFVDTRDSLSGDRLYRNEKGFFHDVTKESGISNSAIGYGLGVCVSDINVDGYPDLYIGNDFHENDYLYINQRNGTYKDELTSRIMHTSQFTMGVDVADVNNDAFPEIITVDMLSDDPYILKRSLGDNDYDVFDLKIRFGYNHQYSRNNLQLNRKNGLFSECGMYSGVYATDWSWAPLWMDFDNDGLKDLFISNGIPKRLNDIDYVNFVSNSEVQDKIKNNRLKEKDMALINRFPEIKLKNKFFKNSGDLVFTDVKDEVSGEVPAYSNGSAYADFDNDGDLDIVVNNIDKHPVVYSNQTITTTSKPFLELTLKGPSSNINAVGSKVIVYTGNNMRTYEKYPVRGFQSSMELPMHVGLYNTKVDSILLIWPDNSVQRIEYNGKHHLSVSYKKDLQKFDYTDFNTRLKDTAAQFADITREVSLPYHHQENTFREFDREPLIPHMISREGPALAIGDLNQDGLDDLFLGSSKGYKSAVFLQQMSGGFRKSLQPQLDADSVFEDVDACWVDVNNDKHLDLVIASGGNEFYGADQHLLPRVYLNDGKANLRKLFNAFDSVYLTASCVIPYDFTGDGYVDLFVGGRAVPWEYGEIPSSFLLENDRTGKFRDVTSDYSKELSKAGFVTNAIWVDLDSDGDQDLVLSLEWDGVCAFINEKGKFIRKFLTDKKGWWNFSLPCDIDKDGDIDFIVGNLGMNNRFQASHKTPVRMYFNDFDGNGKKEQLLTYYLRGKETVFANKDELQKQIPGLKKQYLYAGDFAKASLQEIFTTQKLRNSRVLSADYFSNAILMNHGNLKYRLQSLPWEAQLTTYKDAIIIDANKDSLPDILMVGNYFHSNIQMGRYDADIGTVLVNKGGGSFACRSIGGYQIKGEVRNIANVNIGRNKALLLARNNDSVIVIKQK